MICKTAVLATVASLSAGWRPTSNGSVDSETHPIRCHWNLEADASRCEDVLAYMENAWEIQVDELGFVEPVLGEDGIFDVYITLDSDAGTGGGAYVAGSASDSDPEDGLSGCDSYMALDRDIRDREMESYVAHEFQHVLQWSTDFNEPSLPVWEGVAEAATVWTLGGDRGDYTMPGYYLDDFQEAPWNGLLSDGYYLWDEHELYSFYEYGSALWVFHMEDAYGDGQGSSARELWLALAQEGWTNEPDVLDGLTELTGSWQQYVLDLSLERIWVGTEANPAWTVGQPVDNAVIPIDVELTLEDLPTSVTPTFAPLPTGVAYFSLSGLAGGDVLDLAVTDESERSWGIVVTDGTTHATYEDSTAAYTVGEGGSDVTIGVVHLGAPEWDPDGKVQPADFELSISWTSGEDNVGTDDGGGGGGGDDEEGCGGCTTGAAPALAWLWFGGLGLVAMRRRH